MQFTAAQIAMMVNGTVEGDPNSTVNTIAKIEEGHQGAISFLANPKYTHYIYTTASSIVLVSRDFVAEHPVSATLIRVDDPYATVAMLLQTVDSMMRPNRVGVENPSFVAEGVELPNDVYLGAFAYISQGVVLGKGVKIYPGAFIGEGVKIGDNTIIYPNVTVYHGCIIGDNCIIHSGAVIGADGFGFAPVDGHYNKIPQIGNVIIKDNVEIGANTCVDRATMGSTTIEAGVKLDNLIQVAHNCRVGHDTVMASQSGIAGSTKIGANCMIGGQVGFAGHIEVGDRVNIGAQSGIPRGIKDDSVMMGSPAVDVRAFARQSSAIGMLPDLLKRVSALERKLKQFEKN